MLPLCSRVIAEPVAGTFAGLQPFAPECRELAGDFAHRCAYLHPGAYGDNLWRGECRNLRPGDLWRGGAAIDRSESKAPHCAAKLVGVHARVALRGVQVLVPE